jgi:hypothetical protein
MRSQLRREHFESIGAPAAEIAVAPRPLPNVAPQRISFRITWSGPTAALDHLTYNTVLVQEEPKYDTPNRITVEFTRPLEDVHLFEWTLLFPRKVLTELEASVELDDGAPVSLLREPSAEGAWRRSAHT